MLLAIQWVLVADVIGVSPENQHLYTPIVEEGEGGDEAGGKYWYCLNDTSIKLQFHQINDDICDCPDGSDEPGTNACPSTPFKFYCKNEGHFPGYIDQFKLNDGVCDYDICCDGSDEYKIGNCENKCKEIHQQFEEYRSKKLETISRALEKKKSILMLAQTKRKELIKSLQDLERALPETKLNLNKLKVELEYAEQKEEKSESVYDHLDNEFDGLQRKIDKHIKEMSRQENKIQTLEKILEWLSKNYNPNFNDLAVKDSIHKFQEYISNKEEDDVKDDIHETNKLIKEIINKAKSMSHSGVSEEIAHFVPSLGNMLHHVFRLFSEKFLTKRSEEYVSPLSSNQLTPEIEKLEEKVKTIEQKIFLIKDDLNKDYGPDDVLRAFAQVTITKNLGGYQYKVNLLNSIYQNDVLIGKFKEYKDGKIHFNNGARCWNGPQRSAVVELICGEGLDVVSVSEPEKCHYSFIVQGETWCQPITDNDLQKSFEINYELL
ncbi:hypothetical protein KGF56_002362 [Candida oxycetoniae]|uniref:Glucosidase 2 subunit beta n=1 Tax=Candida oxycetoniae TaxID=497107 RepID=A0AAI9SY29_9ASCO|nr:uncharacterized protein KGF56_002362 [Candida oxycetoniae]KAI3404845.2 hypothetical protein KGF56_002362 [Candida oxycetoniae]